MSPELLESIREVSQSLVHERAPEEDVAFEGIWSDALDNLDTGDLEAVGEKGASQFVGEGAELPLLSAVIVPIALWVGMKVADKAADEVLDHLVARVKKLFSAEKKYEGGTLSDEDIDRLAQAVVQHLAKPLKKKR